MMYTYSTNIIDSSPTVNNNPFKTLNNSKSGTNKNPMSMTIPLYSNKNKNNSDDTNGNVAALDSLVISFF